MRVSTGQYFSINLGVPHSPYPLQPCKDRLSLSHSPLSCVNKLKQQIMFKSFCCKPGETKIHYSLCIAGNLAAGVMIVWFCVCVCVCVCIGLHVSFY